MNSQPVTIFEGPDGSGKSTAAAEYAKLAGARLVHCGPFPRVSDHHLARFYAEAMLPAVLGYQPVVLDRSWISEPIYGAVFRESEDRLGLASARMLERLALRCGAVVVLCQPGWDQVEATYEARRTHEVLNGKRYNLQPLKQIYDLYTTSYHGLPQLRYDWTSGETMRDLAVAVKRTRTPLHPLTLASAGSWDADTVILGQDFGHHKNTDPLYQWPFASFSQEGCSQWLTEQLITSGVGELELLWLNADQDLDQVPDLKDRRVLALGEVAHRAWPAAQLVPHPQSWKRFWSKSVYPLLEKLR